MDILSNLNNVILPGTRVKRFHGWDEFVKFAIPRDSELIGLDYDDSKDHLYMKKCDVNGNEVAMRYKYYPDPVEEFEPGKYVTKNEFDSLKEEMSHGFDSIRELITGAK